MGRAGRLLRQARRRAGYTQRELARRLGVAQSQIARIESGAVVPRVDTLERFLRACGETLTASSRPGVGIDRSLILEQLKLTPRARWEEAAAGAEVIQRIRRVPGKG